ncbi:hypothetical protein 010DV004_274 [Bacillus phage 010DV004]|nr:hypothetical protein 010DV004_274 [Bacillus phage 010DV004]QZA69486.1 hypothetical protein 010DV005_274 [Bacillus phage 010DV005]
MNEYKVTVLLEDGSTKHLLTGEFPDNKSAWVAGYHSLTEEERKEVMHYTVEELVEVEDCAHCGSICGCDYY